MTSLTKLLLIILILPNTLLAESRLENLATRGFIGTGDEVLIGGLVITGNEPKTILIRARGPALALAGVEGAISDTTIILFSGPDIIDSNDDWQLHENADQVPEALQPADSAESVIVRTLDPGAYTAIITGVNDEVGIGLVEIFELSDTGETKLQNIATRGFVGTGDAVMIGGLVISGDEDKTLVIRAKGPSLTSQGVSGALANPELILLSGSTVIDTNNDWQDHARAAEIPLELRPTDNLEAVVLRDLAPGAYTAIVTGFSGTTGVGIVEVFEITELAPPPISAQTFFTENIETSIIQSQCIACHVVGGVAANTNLVFERTSATSDIANYQQFETFVGTDLSTQALVLSKVSGNNHVGGNQLPLGSSGYNDLESFLNLLTNSDSTPSAQPEFFADVNLQPRGSTLRKAAITLAGRLPTISEFAQVTDDASLRIALRSLMEGEAFHEFLLNGANDRLLIRGAREQSFLDNCLECFPTYTNHLYNLFVANPDENDRGEIAAFRFKGRIGLLESPLELVAHVVENDFSYGEVLTANYMMLNPTSNFSVEGTAVFQDMDDVYEFNPGRMTGYYRPGPNTVIEEVEGTQFFQVIDPGDLITTFPHAGILNSLAFLSRYPTTATNRNRARARWTFLHFLDIDIEKSAQRTTDPVALADTNNPTLNNENCTVCHSTMDPVAGAFQNYDEVGLYRSNFGGLDSLDNFYKFRSEEGLYHSGDTWYADMLTPGLFSQQAPDANNSLQWVTQQIVQEPGFSRAAVKFWWPSLMGKEVLLVPEVQTDSNYQSKLSAFDAQSLSIQTLSDQFTQSGLNLKDLLVEMMMTPWFRAESVELGSLNTILKEAHLLADLGNEVLLTPERLQLKTKAITGFNWRSFNPRIEKQQTGLGSTYNLYFGGIDASAITKRATELTPLMSTVAMAHALESACPIVLREFILPDGGRKLFNGIDESMTPLTVGSSNFQLTTTSTVSLDEHTLLIEIPAGLNTVSVSVLDGYCDYDNVNDVCLSQNFLIIASITTLASGETSPETIDIGSLQFDENCGGLIDDNSIALYGQCDVSFTIDVPIAGAYTITSNLSGFKEGLDHVNTNEISASISVSSQATASTAETAGSNAIKLKLIELHQLMLGKTYTMDSSEIKTAFQLYADSWQERQSGSVEGNLFNDTEACDWFSDSEYALGLGFSEDSFINDLYQSGADPNHNKQAWVTVVTYLMTHYHYLHE